jgi:hypothetical protein
VSLRLLAVLALLLIVGGCSGSGKVSGKVTYKGEALGSGVVTFRTDKATATSPIDADGNYRILKAPPGKVQITVETIAPAGGVSKDGKIQGSTFEVSGGSEKPGKYVAIPPKYADPAQSGLTYEVTPGSQTYDIKLE